MRATNVRTASAKRGASKSEPRHSLLANKLRGLSSPLATQVLLSLETRLQHGLGDCFSF